MIPHNVVNGPNESFALMQTMTLYDIVRRVYFRVLVDIITMLTIANKSGQARNTGEQLILSSGT